MKRHLCFLAVLLFPFCGWAQDGGGVPAPNWGGKKLLSMTRIKGNDASRAEFKYDEIGRLSQYSYDSGIEYNFSYSGNQMNIDANSRSFSYIISDGRMASGIIGMESGEDLTVTPEYDSEWRWQKVDRYNSKMIMSAVGQWDGNLLTSITDSYNGKERSTATFSYTSEPAPFFIQTLMINSDFGKPIALNNVGIALGLCLYIGQLPPYLISSATITEGGSTKEYPYTYERNADGDITSFTMGDYTYLLEWDESSGVSTVATDTAKAHVFDLQGNRIETPRKGVNIIQSEDGKAKKIVVR